MAGTTNRWIGAAGIGFAVLTIARFAHLRATGERPDLSGPTGPIIDYVDRYGTGIAAGTWAGLVGFVLLLVFVTHLARRAQPTGGTASTITVSGVVLLLAVMLAGSATLVAGINIAKDGDIEYASDLFRLPTQVDHFLHLPHAVWQAALAVLLLRTGVLARPFGVTLGVLAVAEFAMSLPAVLSDDLGGLEDLPLLGLLAWTLAAGAATVIGRIRTVGAPGATR